MTLARFTKDPDALLDYTMDWSPWLDIGDTITIALVTVPTGIVLETTVNDTTTVTAWVSGGTVGEEYDVVYRITTVDGRVDDRTIRLFVNQR